MTFFPSLGKSNASLIILIINHLNHEYGLVYRVFKHEYWAGFKLAGDCSRITSIMSSNFCAHGKKGGYIESRFCSLCTPLAFCRHGRENGSILKIQCGTCNPLKYCPHGCISNKNCRHCRLLREVGSAPVQRIVVMKVDPSKIKPARCDEHKSRFNKFCEVCHQKRSQQLANIQADMNRGILPPYSQRRKLQANIVNELSMAGASRCLEPMYMDELSMSGASRYPEPVDQESLIETKTMERYVEAPPIPADSWLVLDDLFTPETPVEEPVIPVIEAYVMPPPPPPDWW